MVTGRRRSDQTRRRRRAHPRPELAASPEENGCLPLQPNKRLKLTRRVD